MRLKLRIAMIVTACGLALALAGCQSSPWERADRSLSAVTRQIVDRAEHNDVRYFEGLSPDRQSVPLLIQQVLRSGIATNYAEHLRIESTTDATLVYGGRGTVTPGTSFAVQLSLLDGQVRLDKIELQEREAADGFWAPSGPVTQAISRPSEIPTTAAVSASVPEDLMVAGREGAVLIGYTNVSNEVTSVPLPLDAVVRLTDMKNQQVSKWESPGAGVRKSPALLAPWDTAYVAVRFKAPSDPGVYTLYGSANGLQAWGLNVETVY